jgi:transposase
LGAISLAADQKKARQTGARLVFLDESGFSEAPSVQRTWAPRGQTPILVAPFNWKRLSAIASLLTTPAARRVGLCLRLHQGTIKQPQVLDYLRALKQHIGGRKVVLLWDRLPAHRGGDVQRYIARQASWLTVEYLPPYAPELNPVEYFWSHLSRTDMAQFVGEDLAAVRRQVRRAACAVRHRADLGKAFLKHSGLF